MELWKFECRKLWKNKMICAMLLSCFLVNGFFLYNQTRGYNEKLHCFPNSVNQVYGEMARVPEEKRMQWLYQEMEKADKDEMAYERGNALCYVMENVQENAGYPSYLAGIQKQAELMRESSLFAEEDLFSQRNAELIPGKYEHLYGLTLQAENPQGILIATESKITDVFLVVLVILLAYFFICMEREEGTMAFARCTRYGVKELGKTKIAVVLIGSMVGACFLYLENFLIAGALYGFGDTGRWLQSVKGFLTSPWKIFVRQYIVLFFIGKLAATAVIASLVILIVLKGKNILQTSVVLLGVTAVEYSLYTIIPEHSWLDILKKCNLCYFISTENFFKNYETINLFEYPVSSLFVCTIAGILLILLTVWASISCYEKVSRSEYAKKMKKWNFHLKIREKRMRKHSLLYYESYKMLWLSGAAVIMIAFLGMQYMTYADEKGYFTIDELYYKNYMKQLEGNVTEEKLDYLDVEKKRVRKLELQRYRLMKHHEDYEEREFQEQMDELNQQLQCKTALHQVLWQARRIGKDGVFLNEVGYARLLEKREWINNFGKLLIVFVLAFHSAFIMEQMAGMQTIWNSIANGRRKILARKWILMTVCIIMLCAASDLIFVRYRMQAQGLMSLDYPICYLPGFEGGKTLTIRGYVVGNCLLKMLAGLLTGGIIAGISKRAKNTTTVLLVSGSITGVCYLLLRLLGG